MSLRRRLSLDVTGGMAAAFLFFSGFAWGCFFAERWLLGAFVQAAAFGLLARLAWEERQVAVWVCKTCEGTGMEPSGAYTWDGDLLYDGGTTCPDCKDGFRK